jgi:membrane-bound lytic murein transglycosylase D
MRIKIFIFFSLLFTSFIQAQSIQEIESTLIEVDPAFPWVVEESTLTLITQYLENKNNLSQSLERLQRFEKDISAAMTKHYVPEVLKYAAFALSECNHSFKDEFGGTGFFAMKYNTAVNQGLHISSYVDERRDVVKSSEVFARLMHKYYSDHGDWNIAYTVYCITELEWEKAKILSKSQDFFEASQSLSPSFQMSIPRFNAAVYIFSQISNFNISPTVDLPLETQNVSVNQMVSLLQISEKLDIPLSILRELNPIFKKDIVPRSVNNYELTLPSNKIGLFNEMGDKIYESVKKEKVASDNTENEENKDSKFQIKTEVKSQIEKIDIKPKPSPNTMVWVNYRVKKGDVLYSLSIYFNCSVNDIKTWNNLKSDQINIGQVLKMRVPESKKSYYASIDKMTPTQKAVLRR